MVDANTFKKWAQGNLSNSDAEDDEDVSSNAGDDDGMGEEEAGEDRNVLWAGEGDQDLEGLSVEDAADMLDWLEAEEPELFDAFSGLAEAVASDDTEQIDTAMADVMSAAQQLNPEYPPMDEGQRERAGELIAKHMADKGHPDYGSDEWKQAVAIGLAQARRGE